MAVGAVRRYGAVLGAFAAHVRRVVRVEIQEQPARFQHPVPLGVGFLRLRQRPRQIPAEHDIEGAVREIQLLGIHMPEGNVQPKTCRHGGGFLQHGGGQVDARHRMSQLRHEDGKADFPANFFHADPLTHGDDFHGASRCGKLLGICFHTVSLLIFLLAVFIA